MKKIILFSGQDFIGFIHSFLILYPLCRAYPNKTIIIQHKNSENFQLLPETTILNIANQELTINIVKQEIRFNAENFPFYIQKNIKFQPENILIDCQFQRNKNSASFTKKNLYLTQTYYQPQNPFQSYEEDIQTLLKPLKINCPIIKFKCSLKTPPQKTRLCHSIQTFKKTTKEYEIKSQNANILTLAKIWGHYCSPIENNQFHLEKLSKYHQHKKYFIQKNVQLFPLSAPQSLVKYLLKNGWKCFHPQKKHPIKMIFILHKQTIIEKIKAKYLKYRLRLKKYSVSIESYKSDFELELRLQNPRIF